MRDYSAAESSLPVDGPLELLRTWEKDLAPRTVRPPSLETSSWTFWCTIHLHLVDSLIDGRVGERQSLDARIDAVEEDT